MNENNMIPITRRTLEILKKAQISQEYKTEKHEDMTYIEKDGLSKKWGYKNGREHVSIYRTPHNKKVSLYIEQHFELHGIVGIHERTTDGYVCINTTDYNWIDLRIIEDTEVNDQ